MLRAPELSDVDDIYEWENSPDRLLHGRTGLPYSKLSIRDYIDNYNATALDSGHLRFIIDNAGVAIGLIELYDLDLSASKAFVSIFIAPAHRNKKHASEALDELTCFTRNHLGLQRLCAVVSVENIPSLKLFHNASFQEIASLPDWVRSLQGNLIDAKLLIRNI